MLKLGSEEPVNDHYFTGWGPRKVGFGKYCSMHLNVSAVILTVGVSATLSSRLLLTLLQQCYISIIYI